MHGRRGADPLTGALHSPVVLSSTFVQAAPGEHKGYHYSRAGNPTRTALEGVLADLESGIHAFAFASGCAAITNLLLTLKSGDHILACDDIYGGTYRLMTSILGGFGVEVSFVDFTSRKVILDSLRPNTKMIWTESPSNPLLKICDLSFIAGVARERGIVFAVDNTLATPMLQRPLTLGATVVMQSTTKYLSGHCDVLGGALITDNEQVADKIRLMQKAVGAVPSPSDCSLILRGTQTLILRVTRQVRSAQKIAEWLTTRPEVKKVYYVGLPSHPGHELAKQQMAGPGAMISFEIDETFVTVKEFIRKLALFQCAISLGGVESLVEHPATMSHATIPREVRLHHGIADGLIRLSIGVEGPLDLIRDLETGFEANLRHSSQRPEGPSLG